MEIEMVRANEDTALRPGKEELWIRAVTDTPLGPQDYKLVFEEMDAAQRQALLGFPRQPANFYPDDEFTDDGFGQWWIFRKIG